MGYKNPKELLTAATALPAAIEAKLPAGAPKISTMLLDATAKMPDLPDFLMEGGRPAGGTHITRAARGACGPRSPVRHRGRGKTGGNSANAIASANCNTPGAGVHTAPRRGSGRSDNEKGNVSPKTKNSLN